MTVTEDAVFKKVAWRIMPFLILAYFIASIDRSNVAYAKIGFMEELGFTETIFGIGAGIFFVGYVLFELPSNILLQKMGIRKVILRIMVGWGACCVLLGFMHFAWHFLTLRFLLGVFEAGFFPGVLYYLSFWCGPKKLAQLTAIFMASISISGVLAGPLSAAIMASTDGMLGMSGWRWLFVLEGSPAIFLGIFAFFYLDDNPSKAKWLSDEEKRVLTASIGKPKELNHGGFGEALALLKQRSYLKNALIGTALLGGTAAVMFWVPSILSQFGIEGVVRISLMSSIPFTFGVIAQYLNAKSSDSRQERRLHVALPLLTAGCAWICLYLFPGDLTFSMVLLCVIVSGTFAAMGPFWAMASTSVPDKSRAGGIALIAVIGGVFSAIQPTVLGILADATASLSIGFLMNGGYISVMVLTFLYMAASEARQGLRTTAA